MSIIYCERHDLRWDSDLKDECPACENEHPQMNKSVLQTAFDIVKACPGTGRMTSAQRMFLAGMIAEELSKQRKEGYQDGYEDAERYAEPDPGGKLL